MNDYQGVTEGIHGRLAMSQADADILQEYAAQCASWLEIGVMWGGSLALAGMANPALIMVAIDPFDSVAEGARYDMAERNLERFGIRANVELIEGVSQTYAWGRKFDGIFIDGDHSPDALLADLKNSKKHADKFILFHDMDDPSVADVVAQNMDDWKLLKRSKRIAVYGRQ